MALVVVSDELDQRALFNLRIPSQPLPVRLCSSRLIEMAGASGLLAGSAFFVALEIVFWFGVQFFGGKGGKG